MGGIIYSGMILPWRNFWYVWSSSRLGLVHGLMMSPSPSGLGIRIRARDSPFLAGKAHLKLVTVELNLPLVAKPLSFVARWSVYQ